MGGHARFTSDGIMAVDEPDKKVVKVRREEYWGDGTLAYDDMYIAYTLTRMENYGGYFWIISDIDLTPIYGDKIIKKIFTEEEKKRYKELLLSDWTNNEERKATLEEMKKIIANAKNQEII